MIIAALAPLVGIAAIRAFLHYVHNATLNIA